MVCVLLNICVPFAEAAPIDITFSEAINDTFESETEIVSDNVPAEEEIAAEEQVSEEENHTETDNATTEITRVIVLYKDSSDNKIEADNVTAINDEIDVITLENGTDISGYMNEAVNSNDNIKLIQPDYELELASVSDNWSFKNDTEIKAQFVEKEAYGISDNTDYDYKKSYRIDSNFKKATKNNTGKDVKIAILDTAVNTESDEVNMSHGTAINNLITGIVPESEIVSFDIFGDGKAYISEAVKAIMECEQQNVSIVNCSWIVKQESPILDEVVKNSDMLFVCAAGNDSENLDEHPTYPATYGYDNIISVGAVSADGKLCEYSNYSNSKLDITAQGSNIIIGTDSESEYNGEGTSFSSAFVSAAAAIVYSDNPEILASEVKGNLLDGADSLSTLFENVQDGRFLNALNALNKDKSTDVIVLQNKADEVSKTENSILSLFNAADEFNNHSTMTTKRNKFKSVTVDGTIYVLGGCNENGKLNTAEKYDTNNSEAGWQSISNMPKSNIGFAATTDNDKIYVVGGYNNGQSTSDFQIYDIASDTWSTGTAMPQARERCAAAVCMGKLYVIGGRNNAGWCTSILVYDIDSDSWSEMYSNYFKRLEPNAVTVNNAIYVIGGFTEYGTWSTNCNRIIPFGNSIKNTTVKQAPKAFSDTDIAVRGDCLYFTHIDNDTSYIYTYDTLLKKWSVEEAGALPKYMYYQTALCNDELYLLGGYDEDYSNVVYKKSLTPSIITTEWDFHSNLPSALNQVKILSIDGEKYTVGGFSSGASGSIYKFNELTRRWESETDSYSNVGYSFGGAVENVNDCIYTIGGYNRSYRSFGKSVSKYDLYTKKWTSGTAMSKERERMGSIVYGENIYVFGGRNSTGTLSDIDIYNTRTDTWKSGGSLPQPMMNMAVGIYGHNIVLAGGYDAQGTPLNKYYIYDAETKQIVDSGENALIREDITKVKGINNLMFACKEFSNQDANFIQYDYENGTWNECNLSAELPNFDYASYAADGNKMFVMGGYSVDGNMNSDIVLSTPYSVTEVAVDIPSDADDISSSANITVEKGKSYILTLQATSISEIQNKTFQVRYDKNSLSVLDACAQTWNKDLQVGIVKDTDIEIKKISDSVIQFKINKSQGDISGILNLIKFEAKASGKTNVSIDAIE